MRQISTTLHLTHPYSQKRPCPRTKQPTDRRYNKPTHGGRTPHLWGDQIGLRRFALTHLNPLMRAAYDLSEQDRVFILDFVHVCRCVPWRCSCVALAKVCSHRRLPRLPDCNPGPPALWLNIRGRSVSQPPPPPSLPHTRTPAQSRLARKANVRLTTVHGERPIQVTLGVERRRCHLCPKPRKVQPEGNQYGHLFGCKQRKGD